MEPAFNWGVQDRCIELMNLKMEISNILETRAYKLSEEKKVPKIKRVRMGGYIANTNFHLRGKKKV